MMAKIKNSDIVHFMNASQDILKKKIPNRLYHALSANKSSLRNEAKAYMETYDHIREKELPEEECAKEISELMGMEVEANIQKVRWHVLETMDDVNKYDALTGNELEAIGFMLTE